VTAPPAPGNIAAWQPLALAVAEIRGECSAALELVDDQFQQIDDLRAALQRQAEQLAAAEQRLAERSAELAGQRQESSRLENQLDQQGAQLAAALEQLQALREEVSRQGQAEANHAPASIASQADALSPLLSVLDELRNEVHDTQSKLAGAIQQVATAHADHPPSDSHSAETTLQIVALERARAELEAELELVRTRAAELQQAVQDKNRELADQHNEWTTELRLLRELVEQQAELRPAAQPTVEPLLPLASPRQPAAESSPPSDPVVNSVMAQFARLQKDVAQRRQQQKKK
jgi:chromosome segregation ATPase